MAATDTRAQQSMSSIPDPLGLSRPRNPNRETTDLMVRNVPKVLVDWLDAASMPTGIGRNAFLIALLSREAKAWAHAHMIGARVMGGNSVIAELAGLQTEHGDQHAAD